MLTPSRYFSVEELTRSVTAIREGIDNTIPDRLLPNITRLIDYLDKVREEFGAPISVSSGYRCPDLNKAVGGSKKSQHMQGLAADLVVPELSRLFQTIRKMGGFDQLIWEEPSPHRVWVHVSVAPKGDKPRGQVLRYNGRGYINF